MKLQIGDYYKTAKLHKDDWLSKNTIDEELHVPIKILYKIVDFFGVVNYLIYVKCTFVEYI